MQSVVSFRGRSEFDPYYDAHVAQWTKAEAAIAAQETVEGYCDCCRARVPLRVDGGDRFGDTISLRSGMQCPRGLQGHSRLLLRVIHQQQPHGVCAVFEEGTQFTDALRRTTDLTLLESEYFGAEKPSGTVLRKHGRDVVHQDMTATTYGDNSVDLVVHSGVIEHVPDDVAAFRDHHRILRPGGLLAFSAPFFVHLDETVVLATMGEDGEPRVVGDPVYHGDPMGDLILTYHLHGWDLLDRVAAAGFVDVAVQLCFDPDSGLLSDNHPVIRGGNNPPLLITARKPAGS